MSRIVDKENDKGIPISNWLETLRKHSWELELLLTGFVLVGLFQVPALLDKYFEIWAANVATNRLTMNFFGITIRTLHTSTQIIIINLIVLLALRGYWIGLIGLDSAFPEGINFNNLSFADRFTNFFRKKIPSLEKSIINLDKICSTIFAFTFLIISISISIGLYLIFFILYIAMMNFIGSGFIPSLISIPVNIILLIVLLLYLIFGLLSVIDFFGLGILKRIKAKWFSVTYFYASRILRILTLSFLAESIYYILASNISKKVIRIVLIGFVIVVLGIILGLDYDKHIYWPPTTQHTAMRMTANEYENLSPHEDVIETPIIQSDIISDKYIKLFIPYDVDHNKDIREQCPSMKKFKNAFGFRYFSVNISDSSGAETDMQQVLECFKEFYIVSVNNSVYSNLDFLFYRHPNNNEPGIITYIPTYHLPKGKNVLGVKMGKDAKSTDFIPFWLE